MKSCRLSINKHLYADDIIGSIALPESTNDCEAPPTTEKTNATKETQTDLIITHVHELLLGMIDDHLANSFANGLDFNDIPGLFSFFEQQAFMSAMFGMPQQHPQWMPQQQHFNPAFIRELNNNHGAERIQDVQIEELSVYNVQESEKESSVEVTSTTKNRPKKRAGRRVGT